MQISKEKKKRTKNGRNILLLFYKLEILTLKTGSRIFLEETGVAIHRKYHLGSWKRDVWASRCAFGTQNRSLSPFAFASVGLRRDWSKRWLKSLVHSLGFSNSVCFQKEWSPLQATVQGNRVFWNARNSWLEQQPGPRDQQYTEFSALAWIVTPWKLEQSLVLVSECSMGAVEKSRFHGLLEPDTQENQIILGYPQLAPRAAFNTQNKGTEKNLRGLQQLPRSLSKPFPCSSDDRWTSCLATFSLKRWELFLSWPFSTKNQSRSLALETRVAAAVFPAEAELLFGSNHQEIRFLSF